MSNPVGAQRYGLGGGDAYYDAVKYGGYTGTREQFGRDQAEFAQNATAVAQAKEEVERNTQTVVNTAQTFTEETVPAAIQSVEEKGDTEEDRLEARTTELVQSINTAGAVQVQAVEDEGTEQIRLVSGAGTAQVEAVEQAGSDQVDAVEEAGSTQVGNVNNAGTTQVGNVNNAGSTQISAVNSEGSTQVQAVQDKGTEVLNSIPSDYTELTEDVDNLKTSLNYDDGNLMNDNNTIAGWINAAGWRSIQISPTKLERLTGFIPVEEGEEYTAYCAIPSTGDFVVCFVFYSQARDGNTALVSRQVYSDSKLYNEERYNFVSVTVPSGAYFVRVYVNSYGLPNYYLFNTSDKETPVLQALRSKYAIAESEDKITVEVKKATSYSNASSTQALLRLLHSVAYTSPDAATLLNAYYDAIGEENVETVDSFAYHKYASEDASVGYKTNGLRLTPNKLYFDCDTQFNYILNGTFDISLKPWVTVILLDQTAVDNIENLQNYSSANYYSTGWQEMTENSFVFDPLAYNIPSGNLPVAFRFSLAFGDDHNTDFPQSAMTIVEIKRKVSK